MIAPRTRTKSLIAIAIAVSLATLVWGTPGAGTIINVVLNRATVANPIHALAHYGEWSAILLTTDKTDVIIQNVQLAPGGYSGWHSHLGPVILTVKSGTATMYRVEHGRCEKFVYAAGSAFVEPVGPHSLRNESASDVLETFNAHIIPAGAPQRVDEPDPGVCPGVL